MKKLFAIVAAVFTALTINAQALTVAQAIEAAMALDSAAVSADSVLVEGFVVDAEDFQPAYGNQIFFLADDAANSGNQKFEVYGGVAKEGDQVLPVLNGDKVQVKAKLKKYWDKNASAFLAETVNGDVTFISKVDGDRTIATIEEITVARALELGGALADNGKTTETYNIIGYVTKIDENALASHGNMTFWIADAPGTAATNADGAFEVYRGKPDKELKVGNKVKVTSVIQKYVKSGNTTIETTSGVPVLFLEEGETGPEADVVFLPADFADMGTANTGSEVSVTKNGVTVLTDKGYGHSLALRVYTGGHFSITSATESIAKIVFSFATVSEKYYNGGLADEIVVNGLEWLANGGDTLKAQARCEKIEIFFGTIEFDSLNVAGAVEEALKLDNNAVSADQYVITGYVAKIKTAYNEQYSNITFFMTDDPTSTYGDLQVYRGKIAAADGPSLAAGDKVQVIGKLKNNFYNDANTAYVNEGSDVIVLEKAPQGIENVVLTEQAQKVVVDGVLYIVRDGKMYNVQGTQVR